MNSTDKKLEKDKEIVTDVNKTLTTMIVFGCIKLCPLKLFSY